MYCKKCGVKLMEGAAFCKECGTTQNPQLRTDKANEISDKTNSDESHEYNDENSDLYSDADDRNSEVINSYRIFHSDDEILIDSLGSGFLSNIVANSNFNKAVIICSNKRVYQKGKLIFRDSQRKLIYAKGEAVVDLKDITGMFYEIINPVFRLVHFAFFFFLFLIALFIAETEPYLAEDIYTVMGVISFIGLIFLIAYYAKKKKYFVIQHAGGEILADSNWYKVSSIRRFMKTVSKQKDKITNY